MPWVGGKNSCADKIVEMMPEHYCYVEVFFGGGWVYYAKPVSKVETVNDLNGELVNFYRVLQRNHKEFEERSKYELYARDLYYEYERDWKSGAHFKMSDVERSFRFFVLIREAYSAKFGGGWSYGATRNKPKSFFDIFRDGSIDKVSERLKNTYIDNRDFGDVIKGYDGEKTLFLCCLPGTKVRMRDERLLNIEDVKIGDIVFSGGKVLNTLVREYNGNVYEFEITGIYDNLVITEEHPLAVIRQNNAYSIKEKKWSKFKNQNELNKLGIEFVNAKDIRAGDFLLVPCYPEVINDVEIVKVGNVDIKCDAYFGWIVGMWLAEGNIQHYYKKGLSGKNELNDIIEGKQGTLFDYIDSKINLEEMIKINEYESSRNLVYSLGEKDINRGLVEKLDNWYNKYFGKTGSISNPSINEYQIWYSVEDMAKFLNEKFGEGAHEKYISTEIMSYPIEFQRGLLRGWLDGDGGIWGDEQNRGKVTGTSVSERLALDMYLVALRLGIKPSLKKRGNNWDMYFSSIDDIKYLYPDYSVDVKTRTKRKIIEKNGIKYIMTPITKIIRRRYIGKVHNLTTENNVFVSNYILTHNCDPPYVLAPVDDYYFRSMGVGFKAGINAGFSLYDQQRLYKLLSGMKGKFILTIDDCAWVRERYCDGQEELENLGERKFWWIDNEIYYTSSDMENRRTAKELIICNYNIQEQIERNKKFSRGRAGESLADY